ncbi:MAG: hypothetical protein J1F61_00805 [Clostridiales bacterium]|nr:hypothetical protein [Clostridiales bacterium]
MKYICEICGCTLDDQNKMAEHEEQCRANNQSLIYCIDELNKLIGLAAVTPFLIVAEVPIIDADTTPQLKYYPIAGTELDSKRKRCILKVKNVDPPKPAEKSTAQSKTKSNK